MEAIHPTVQICQECVTQAHFNFCLRKICKSLLDP